MNRACLINVTQVYIINNSGHKIDPCGTPVVILCKLRLMPQNCAYCLLFDK